jgi:hypothetical protein
MEHIKKLYGKAYHLYTIEDWKYIFSIYKEKDKYNHTEEEFLAAELTDKTAMMKKMDENIWKYGWNTTIDEHIKPLVDSCSENSCETINSFLDDKDVKDINEINHSGGIPACSSEDTCEAIQELLDIKDEPYALYLSIKKDVEKNIQYHEDNINDLLIEIKRNLVMIEESKHRLKISYERYIKIM